MLQAIDWGFTMKGKHRKTLAAVFRDPVSGTIEWTAVEGLLIAAGARVIEGRGSRVRFEKDGEVETFLLILPRRPSAMWSEAGGPPGSKSGACTQGSSRNLGGLVFSTGMGRRGRRDRSGPGSRGSVRPRGAKRAKRW